MPDDAQLRTLSKELLDRLGTEETRPVDAPATHLVGGIVKAGSKLEGFLREVLIYAAAAEGVPAERLLAAVGGPGGKKPSLRKAMAGSLAHGLRGYYGTRTAPALVRPLIDDLRSTSSTILGFIAARNDIAKEGGDPAPGRAAAQSLRVLVEGFRKNAGWE